VEIIDSELNYQKYKYPDDRDMKIQYVNPWDINEGDIYDSVFINYSKTQTVATDNSKSLSREEIESILGQTNLYNYFACATTPPKKKIIKRIV
jgi:hypothetical protein